MISLLSLALVFLLSVATPVLAQVCDDGPPPPKGDQPTT